MRAIPLFLFLYIVPAVSAVTYQVGPSRPYQDLQSLTALLEPGDIVEVDGDVTYPGGVVFTEPGTETDWITIRGIRINGHRPIISGGTNTVMFQTDWPYSGPGADYYVLEGFEIIGGTFRGIFHQAAHLLVRDTVVHDCPAHGILGADEGSGSLTLDHIEVYHCGSGDSQHQIYMATDEVGRPGSVFRMQFCYVHDGIGGNNVKSRAQRNEIYYNWIEGAYYHELELIGPDGADPGLFREDSDVVGNVLRKLNDFSVTRVGGDGTGETFGRYRFVNNTFISGSGSVFRIFDGIESIEMHNNVFYRSSGGCNITRTVEAVWGSGGEQIAGSNNWVVTGSTNIPSQWTGTISGSNPGFTDFASGNFIPVSGSPLIDTGTASPAGPPGYPFPDPLFPPEYHPPLHSLAAGTSMTVRPNDGYPDIGAFESRSILYVDDSNLTGTQTGSMLYPFIAIQTAINSAGSGDSIYVAAGTYAENCILDDKSLTLSGGFPGGDPSDYASGTGGDFSVFDPETHLTTIQALSSSSAALALIHTGATGSLIEGFSITGGSHGILIDDEVTWPLITHVTISRNDIHHNGATGVSGHTGGGLMLNGEFIEVSGNTIRQNDAGLGAGIYADVSNLTISGNLIEQNTGHGDHGGGLYLNGLSISVTGNTIRRNRTGEAVGYGWGGGILVLGSASLSGNEFYENHAPSIGGGVFVDEGATAVLHHELIHHNTTDAPDKGGAGVYVDGGAGPSHAEIINCTIAMNTAQGTSGGNGVYIEGDSSAAVSNTIFHGNSDDDYYVEAGCSLTVSYTMSTESWPGIGNLVADPRFADPAGNDFHLKSTTGRWHAGSGTWIMDPVHSTAIDAGDPVSDFDLEPSPNGSRINMGVYGNTAEASLSHTGPPVPAQTSMSMAVLFVLMGLGICRRRHR